MAKPRPYWKGFLKLSLVSCPVALFAASSQSEKTHFHRINRETGNRLRQQLVDEVSGEVVASENRAKGYEVASGRYVVIEPEELEAIAIESTHTLDIEHFVPAAEIDKRYYERPYYVAPNGKGADEAFVVIRDAMKDKGRVALARITFANREHIVALEALGKGLLCTTLRYDYEVRREDDVFEDVPAPRVSKEMVDLAAHILDSKSGRFEPAAFKDAYEDALRELIERKAAGKTIGKKPVRETKTNVVDLLAALRESVKKGSGASTPTPRKRVSKSKRAA